MVAIYKVIEEQKILMYFELSRKLDKKNLKVKLDQFFIMFHLLANRYGCL